MTNVEASQGENLEISTTYDGRVSVVSADRWHQSEYTPAQARELAAALLRAADEAEGRPEGEGHRNPGVGDGARLHQHGDEPGTQQGCPRGPDRRRADGRAARAAPVSISVTYAVTGP